MEQREEITDLFRPEAIAKIKVGTVLKFNYEGTITTIKVTRKTKDRIWGKHIKPLIPANEAMSHYGHNIDVTMTPVWCSDCEVPVRDASTKMGRDKYHRRQEDGEDVQEV